MAAACCCITERGAGERLSIGTSCIYCRDGNDRNTRANKAEATKAATGWRTAPSAHLFHLVRPRHLLLLRRVRDRRESWRQAAQDPQQS